MKAVQKRVGRQSLWNQVDGFDRAQSIAVSHAILLAFVITLTLSVAAVGIGPLTNAQAEAMSGIAEDRFDEWDKTIRSTIESTDPQRQSMTVPTGVYASSVEKTEITFTNQDTGSETIISTVWFRYSPRGSDRVITYDSGLVTDQTGETAQPSVKQPPSSTHFKTGGMDIYTLDLIEYDLDSPITFQTSYSRDYTYDVYPNASNITEIDHGTTTDTTIEVRGPNYESWGRYFSDNERDGETGIYTAVDIDHDNQIAKAVIENTEFRATAQYVALNESNI